MIPRLIGITGKAGAGKDTFADALVSQRGATKYNFALPIKQALNAMFGWEMAQWDDRHWKEAPIAWLGKSPRQCAQTLGTEWGRELITPDLWTLIAMERFRSHNEFNPTLPFVIADVRFDNEADHIHARGGVVLEAVRPGITSVHAHVSEKGVSPDKIDYVVYNDMGIRDLIMSGIAILDGWTEFA